MSEEPYSKIEVDGKLENLHTELRHFNKEHSQHHEYQKSKLDKIENKLDYTNAKLRKIIIAIVFLGGIVLGMLFDAKELVQIFIKTVL